MHLYVCYFFFFNDTATTEIYTLSLHDALPISLPLKTPDAARPFSQLREFANVPLSGVRSVNAPAAMYFVISDRKSTRLNSSHANISYAVFCLKKKKNPLT